jgi:glycerophosphoryl diester phosphodiesterase
MNAEMIEFDIHRTSDSELVVHHDPDIGGKLICDLTSQQAAEAAEAEGYSLATFKQVIEIAGGIVPMDIELKEAGYEEQVLDMVLGRLDPSHFLISSSLDSAIAKVKSIDPRVRTGIVLGMKSFPGIVRELMPGPRVRSTGVDVLVVDKRLLKMGFYFLNRSLGKPIWVYTVNDRKELWGFIEGNKVDGIFTNRTDVGLFLRDLYLVQNEERVSETSE